MKVRPLHDRLVVKRSTAPTQSAGGILLPGAADEKPLEGEVMAIGAGAIMVNGAVRPMGVKVGEKIIFKAYAGTELKLDGGQYLMLTEDDVLGVVEA